jgi:hypothetical protein
LPKKFEVYIGLFQWIRQVQLDFPLGYTVVAAFVELTDSEADPCEADPCEADPWGLGCWLVEALTYE